MTAFSSMAFRCVLVALAVCAGALEEPLAQDNECLQDAECSLHALQRRAESRKISGHHAATGPGIPGMGDIPDEDDEPVISDDHEEPESEDEEHESSEDESSEDESSEHESSEHESSDEPQESEADEPETVARPSMPPLPSRPPMPTPRTVQSVNPVVTKGNFLYDSVTGKRFFAKGVAYNPRNEKYDKSFGQNVKVEGWVDHCVPGHPKGGEWTYTEDVIADEHEDMWSMDLEAMANLGANTVRLYNVDPKNNHSKFMNKAASLGIYVIVPLNGKDWGFLPAFPAPDCYTQDIEEYGNVGVNALSFAKQVVKEFSQFNNTLLFTVANELAQNDKNGWAAFPCVKALTRDVHRYQKSCGSSMRRVPLIYSDVDMGAGDRGDVAQYLTCALDSEDDAVDVYGLNVYSWCDETYPGEGIADNFQYSPYYEIKKDFKDLSVPMLFTEFGCNLGVFKTKCPYPDGRRWPEVKHLVGKDMGQIISGAIAFQWSMDKEEYGLTLSPNFLANQTELYLLDNYFNLQKVFHEYNVSTAWDASPQEVAQCSFVPEEVHALEDKHHRPTCPSESVWLKMMRKHRVDKLSNWTEIPPPPNATESALWHVGGQAECPAVEISMAMKENNLCHENNTSVL